MINASETPVSNNRASVILIRSLVVLAVLFIGLAASMLLFQSKAEPKTSLIQPVCAPDGRKCAIWGSTNCQGQPFPFYDRLWLIAEDESVRTLCGKQNVDNIVPSFISLPVWDNKGQRLAWLTFTPAGTKLTIYQIVTKTRESRQIPAQMMASELSIDINTANDPNKWPDGMIVTYGIIGWNPSSSHIVLSMNSTSKEKSSYTLWMVNIQDNSVRKLASFKKTPTSINPDRLTAWIDEKLLYVYDGKIYQIDPVDNTKQEPLHISGIKQIVSYDANSVLAIQREKKYSRLLKLDLNKKQSTVLLSSTDTLSEPQIGANKLPIVRLGNYKSGYSLLAVTGEGQTKVLTKTRKPFLFCAGNDGKNSVIWISEDRVERLLLDGANIVAKHKISVQ